MMGKEQLNVSLQAKSPFELRVNLGRGVPESDVRTALATGDMGFLHSFTTGSTVDGPGVRVVDRKSTRLNSSHLVISYAVFCLKKKNTRGPYRSNATAR